VIHGAGTIEDKLIKDKSVESFERVLATKVDSLITLAAHVRPDRLRYLAIFSSISARMGNRGQADYAAASEVLNKLALELDRQWPSTHVVSLNWGPWLATGMVSPEVQRQFAERGVPLIPIEVGCAALVDELQLGHPGEVEIVVGGWSDDSARSSASTYGPQRHDHSDHFPGLPLLARHTRTTWTENGIEIQRKFSVETDRYLDDHRVDGQPVLPLSVAMELMAEAAVATSPHLTVRGVHRLRLLKGVVLDGDRDVAVRIVASPHPGDGEGRRVHVVVTAVDGPPIRHYETVVDLGPATSAAFNMEKPAPLQFSESPELAVDEAYTNILFHGPLMQAIETIAAIGPAGAQAILRPSAPAMVLEGAHEREQWLLDPILIDASIQLQLVWARQQWGVTSLPTSLQSYVLLPVLRGRSPRVAARDLRETDREPVIRCEMRIRPDSAAPISHADFFFYAPDGQLVAHATDFELVGSAALNRLAARRSGR
jgi:hypothetical protein